MATSIDVRAKGSRAELAVRDTLRKASGLEFERTPSSGALSAKFKLKGDIYVPAVTNVYTIEVKHYADDHLTSKILTDKSPQFLEWWNQATREAAQNGNNPLLIFKFDRSKQFVAFFEGTPNKSSKYFVLNYPEHKPIIITKLDDWLEATKDEIKWVIK